MRDMLHKDLLGLLRRLGLVRQPNTVGDTENVRIDRHGGLTEGHGQHHIGRLPAHTRQTGQLLHRAGDLPLEVGDDHLSHRQDMFSLGIRV